ncbi:MAG: chemotaxis-specific protein-glutamate methyltransferase CheB [Rubripirellula sp.]|nr:chemotaxis-specific protein-glutamate methyltransferase CheB [Rubripirellula sp.]
MSLQVVVVDDSTVFRKAVRDCLREMDGVEVVDVARDGRIALEKIRRIRPDVITLDIEMPVMNGLDVLQAIQQENLETKAIVVSSFVKEGSMTSTRAIAAGAFDFVQKSSHANPEENVRDLNIQLTRCMKVLHRRRLSESPECGEDTGESVADETSIDVTDKVAPNTNSLIQSQSQTAATIDVEPTRALDAICIGVSTGGPQALGKLVPALRKEIRVPVLIVQHMPAIFTESLANHLDSISQLNVVEAEDGMPLRGGTVFIAPGGRQMKVIGYPGAWKLEITDEEPVKGCRPSVDLLFQSAAVQFQNGLLGIVMTGLGNDGVDGAAAITQRGGRIWVQDEKSATVYGMPRAVFESGLPCEEYSLEELIVQINRVGRQSSKQLLDPSSQPTPVQPTPVVGEAIG